MTNSIKISNIEIISYNKPKNWLLGFASCVINGQYSLSDIAIFLRPKGGIRLGYPISMLSNGITMKIFKPLRRDTERSIEAAITEKFGALDGPIR